MRKFLKKYMPSNEKIANNKSLNSLAGFFKDSRLWGLNRHSVARAVSIGLFVSMIPMPFQMLVAAFLAILFHSNLPVSVVLVWITNPLTMPVIFYANYKLGAVILQLDYQKQSSEKFLQWLKINISDILPPLLLGCLIVGLVLAILGNILVRILWRWSVSARWQKRKQRIIARIKERRERENKQSQTKNSTQDLEDKNKNLNDLNN